MDNNNSGNNISAILSRISRKTALLIGGIAVLFILVISAVFLLASHKSKPTAVPKKYSTIPKNAQFVPDQLIVQFQKGVDPQSGSVKSDLKQLRMISATQMYPKVSDDSLQSFYLLTFPSGSDIRKIHDVLQQKNYVEGADPNYNMSIQDVPNDTYYPQMWHLAKIQADKAWDISKGSDSVIVAIVDTGIDVNQPDLAGRKIIVGGDFSGCITSPCTPGASITDNEGHGTHVAGTIGAVSNNALGVTGVDWNVTLLGEKVFSGRGGNSLAPSLGIIDAVNQGAKVINLSFGGDAPCGSYQAVVDYAISKGVTVVVAAGNSNVDASTFSPANCNGVIVVGATDPNDQRSIWSVNPSQASNYGSTVDIAAPGTNILSLKSTTCTSQDCQSSVTIGSHYMYDSGTSMATPQVAGVAALILAQNPNFTPDQVKQCLINSGDPIHTDKPIGGVRLNAYKALNGCGKGLSSSATNTIQGEAYIDTNDNNKLDSGENPFSGATITLSGPQNGTATSDGDGMYSFSNLPDGHYTLTDTVDGKVLTQYSFDLPNASSPYIINIPVPSSYAPLPPPDSSSGSADSGDDSGDSSSSSASSNLVPIEYYDCKMTTAPTKGKSLGMSSMQCSPAGSILVTPTPTPTPAY